MILEVIVVGNGYGDMSSNPGLGSSALVRQLVYEKEFKPVKLHLKFDLVWYPARAEGLVNLHNVTVGRDANVDLVTFTVILTKIEGRQKYQVSKFYCSAGGKRKLSKFLVMWKGLQKSMSDKIGVED